MIHFQNLLLFFQTGKSFQSPPSFVSLYFFKAPLSGFKKIEAPPSFSSIPPCTINNERSLNHSIALRALGWEPLKTERKKAKAKMMYKVLNKMGPKSLTNLFSYKCEKINYNLRDISSGLSLPKPRTNNMKNSFMYDGAHLWNSIPKEIRESKTLSSFRNKIAAHKIDIE